MELQSADSANYTDCFDTMVVEFTIKSEGCGPSESGQVEEVAVENKVKTFLCPICNHSFMARGSVYKHIRLAHNTRCSKVKNNGSVKCQEENCYEYVHSIERLREHLEEKHNIHFEIETVIFSNYQEFIAWKSQMELYTKSSFFKIRGDKKMRRGHIEKYWCNRSGFYFSTKQRKLRKRKSSCKIGGHCTATLTVHVDKLVTVQYCSTHYNHDTDLEYLPIPSHVMADIANDLQNGLERTTILDKNKLRTSTEEVNRSHLLTLKDIYNVEQKLRLLERHKKECSECQTLNLISSKCKYTGAVARYVQHQGRYSNEHVQLSKSDFRNMSGTEEILQAIGYNDEESVEKKREHIELLLCNVRAKMLDCQSSTTLSNVTKSLAQNLYELSFPPDENLETSQQRNTCEEPKNVEQPYEVCHRKQEPAKKLQRLEKALERAPVKCDFIHGVDICDHSYFSVL